MKTPTPTLARRASTAPLSRPILPGPCPEISTDLREAVAGAAGYADADKADSTKLAYAGHFRRFAAWCAATGGLPSLPTTPEIVMAYLSALGAAGRKMSTIEQACAAIAYTHERAGHPWENPPLLRRTRAGLRNSLSVAVEKKAPVETETLARIVATCTDGSAGIRDRAILLVGWAGAFRRSEIVALDVSDVTFDGDDMRIVLRRSKTDQKGAGIEKGIVHADDPALCPVAALRAWLDACGATEGPIFRSLRVGREPTRLGAQVVALIVKAHCRAAGIDPATYSGHSLRAGFVTTAARHDKPLDQIMRQTGHRKADTVLGYIRHADVLKKNAGSGLL